jgi:hypothetical protein
MFSQVTKTSAIKEHAIHLETIGEFERLFFLEDRRFCLEVDPFDLRLEAVSSNKEQSLSSTWSTSETSPTK